MNPQNKKTQPPKHISLLLLTKNEQENIKKNFTWLKKCPVVNEIIAVDSYSTDNTQKELKKLQTNKLKIKFFQRELANDFSQQRIFALSKTTNNWILWLDADEKPSPKLIKFLNSFNFNQMKSFSFRRQDIFLGHRLKHGETASLRFVRLFNKNYGLFERPIHEIWHSRLPIHHSNLKILHYSHPTLDSLLTKINFYTDIRAQELYQQQVKTNLCQIIFFPFFKFIHNYFLRLGFLDSTPGLILGLSMSLHSFLVRAKLWHLYQQSP